MLNAQEPDAFALEHVAVAGRNNIEPVTLGIIEYPAQHPCDKCRYFRGDESIHILVSFEEKDRIPFGLCERCFPQYLVQVDDAKYKSHWC